MPDEDRALAILLGHLLNEMNVLTKPLLLIQLESDQSEAVVRARACQEMVYLRLLAGKLNEAWILLEKGYFKTKLSKNYADEISVAGTTALERLKRYFGARNALNLVRNNFAFHYSLSKAKSAGLNEADAVLYLHEHVGNSLYHFSDAIVNQSLLDTIEPKNSETAMVRLFGETLGASSDFQALAGAIMVAILWRHVMPEEAPAEEIEVASPDIAQTQFPYFFDVPAEPPR